VAFHLATGIGCKVAILRDKAALEGGYHLSQQKHQHPLQPVVIYQSGRSGRRGGWWIATIIQVELGAGAFCTANILFSNFLPNNVKEMMPVTQWYFELAMTFLGQGILRVRNALSKQILDLGIKQDKLSKKMDKMHNGVLGLRDDLGSICMHIIGIVSAMSRCKGSLANAAGRQTYMSRGMSLLV
jgi:hypothetical protein